MDLRITKEEENIQLKAALLRTGMIALVVGLVLSGCGSQAAPQPAAAPAQPAASAATTVLAPTAEPGVAPTAPAAPARDVATHVVFMDEGK